MERCVMMLETLLVWIVALSVRVHSNTNHDSVIDLLAALNMSHIKGVSRLRPPSLAYRLRSRTPHLILPHEYSLSLHSTIQGSMGVHLLGLQELNSTATLLSLSSSSTTILQIISSTHDSALRFDYQAMTGVQGLTNVRFPGKNPFSGANWVQMAVGLEPDRMVIFVNCQEAVVLPRRREERINLELPEDVVVSLASTPGQRDSKFIGYLKTAEISLTAYQSRPWHCDNVTEAISPTSSRKPHISYRPRDKPSHYLPDIQSDQLKSLVVLGPPGSPRIGAPAQEEQRLTKLEKKLEELERMLDMVKAQNADLQSRVDYLEGCECVRQRCIWEGRDVEDGRRWQIDLNTVCICTSGNVTCKPNIEDFCLCSPSQKGVACCILTSDSGGFHCSRLSNTDEPVCHTASWCCRPLSDQLIAEDSSATWRLRRKGCEVDGKVHNVSTVGGCHTCICKGGNRDCSPLPCPPLDCTQYETIPGECCQQCRGCVHSGVRYDHRAKWRPSENPCDICYCLEGHVHCEREQCHTPCENPASPPPNTCCPVCQGCSADGLDFPNGASIPTGDLCQGCRCVNGNVVCSPVSCPALPCRKPLHRAGECCPRCEQCEHESNIYLDGQIVPSKTDPCLRCSCSAGEVSCENRDASCPVPHCRHPAKPTGECCPTCKDCEYDRRVYADGNVFVPAGSGPCLQCKCKRGNVICHEKKCPPIKCSNPVIDSQLCCPICKACMSDGVEYEEGSRWHPEDPCSVCTCVNGEVTCARSHCPPTSCLHPTKISGSCCAVCDSCNYNHRIYSNGQRFTTPDHPCHICTCLRGSVECEDRPCPSVNCSNPYVPPGECCPKCPDCSFGNHVFVDGEVFPNPVSVCEECTCMSGRIDCQRSQCPRPRCNSPLAGRCCHNSCNGCSYAGKEYPNGQEFPHPTDPCRTCSCTNGNVQCLMTRCSPLPCSNPNLLPGDCCPRCPAPPLECVHNHQVYRHSERFYDPADDCRSCVCTNGTVRCQRKPCPFAQCSHPIIQQCCRTCEGCLFEGRERANGEIWHDVSDPCTECTCHEGSVQCKQKHCPPTNCNHPVQRLCCLSCHGEEYLDGSEFRDDKDPCTLCYCYGGDVTCTKEPCYENCSHPYRAPGQCCRECERCFYNGAVLVNGQSVPDPGNFCSECTCQSGSVRCVKKQCVVAVCPHPVTDACGCPVCDGCVFEGVTFADGQVLPGGEDRCQDCTCSKGEVMCVRRHCLAVTCTHPALDGCACEVCNGCRFHGRDCFSGERFPHPTDRCQLCSCLSGSVRCVKKQCVVAVCSHPVTDACGCPVCDGCLFEGVTFADGQVLPGGEDRCQDCTCSKGEVVCVRRHCPAMTCTHPALDGCACEVCNGCRFHGRDCFSGERFPHPTDRCQLCSCLSGSVQCVKKQCVMAVCPHPVTDGCGCPVCDGCLFDGVTFADGQVLPGGEDRCQDCTCSKGEVVCVRRHCPAVTCTHPALDGCACDVCDGCRFHGRDCFSGERFPHPTDRCQLCSCLNGGVVCMHVSCPSVACVRPMTPPGECCPVCTGICLHHGKEYQSGSSFTSPSDPCSSCSCLNEVVNCHKRPCPVQCSHPVPSDTCCPVCDSCLYDGVVHSHGLTFTPSSNPCQRCTCVRGTVTCVPRICPPASCVRPVTKPGQCCPQCTDCLLDGQEYSDGQTWTLRSNPCSTCTCQAGEVRCVAPDCPQLNCMHEVTDPGACCPRCRGCVHDREERREGSSWFADSTPCMTCMCVDGVTTCSEVRCLSPCINSISVPGECCPICADCVFEGRVYSPGDSFHPANDPCQICTCEMMPDGEQHLRCYWKQCPSLVDCPKNNIIFSGPDSCCPVCAQPLSNCTATLIGNEVLATDDPCFTCQCMDFTWTCLHRNCLPLTCPLNEQFTPTDSCCPVCKDCVIEGQNGRVSNGSTWMDSDDDCVTCTCNMGYIECSIEECLPAVCPDGHKQVKIPGKCCHECRDTGVSCLHQGTVYQSNEQWEVDECTSCTCVSGDVHCHSERCPPLTCATDEMPAVVPGLCCPHCLPRPATCIAFGDPHYRTFDGRMLHFQGSCTYVLAEDCEGGDFSIHVTNDDRGRKGVSWTKEVTVFIDDVMVQLLQDWVVKVNDEVVTLPFLKEPYIYIERQTNTILLNTNIGLKVLWSGRSHLEVSVPGSYKGHTCGLCGNFNNYHQDDLQMPSGQLSVSEAEFGNSWRVTNGSHSLSSCRPGEEVDPCKDAGYQARKGANARCKVLKSAVFKPCHRVVPPEPWYGACVYDLCACGANTEECLCDALEAYVSQCREAGVILQWRSPSLCAVGCPVERGFVFDECGPPCPVTCFNVDVPLGVIESHCFKPCVPGCQCPAGLVLHNNYCVHPEKCPKIIHGNTS